MKVRIVKCSNPRLWYRDAVGGEFDAVASSLGTRDVRVLPPPEKTTIRFINHGDYEVVTSPADGYATSSPCEFCGGKVVLTPNLKSLCQSCWTLQETLPAPKLTEEEYHFGEQLESNEYARIRSIVREELAQYNFEGRIFALENSQITDVVRGVPPYIAGLIDRVKALEGRTDCDGRVHDLAGRVLAIEAWAGSLKEWVATLQRLVQMGVVKP